MRIGYDVASLGSAELTGIGQSTKQFLNQAVLRKDLNFTPFLKASRRRRRRQVDAHLTRPSTLFYPWSPWTLSDIDVYHGPDFKVPCGGRFAKVVTVHDLVEFQDAYNSADFIRKAKRDMRHLISRARPHLVIAVSEFTKRELVRWFPEVADRVRVVPHGADHLRPGSQEIEALKIKPRARTVLAVGTIEKRKNQGRLIEAFLASSLPRAGFRLQLVGKKGHGADEELRFAAHPSIDVLGFVDGARLRWLYAEAAVFAFPSLYEGFGFPILEAMLWGAPVITNGQGACRETSGNAAWHVDPRSTSGIREALEGLAYSSERSAEIRHKGFRHASAFTWASCVRGTWDVYAEALEVRKNGRTRRDSPASGEEAISA